MVRICSSLQPMKRLPAVFYALPSGREPVRDWLKSLDMADRKIVGEGVKDVEFAWPIGMPLCGISAAACGKYEAISPTDELAAFSFVCTAPAWCCCTGSSRKPKRRRRPNSILPRKERKLSDE